MPFPYEHSLVMVTTGLSKILKRERESRGGLPGVPSLIVIMVYVPDVKQHLKNLGKRRRRRRRRERERETETETDRDRDRQTDRDKERQRQVCFTFDGSNMLEPTRQKTYLLIM